MHFRNKKGSRLASIFCAKLLVNTPAFEPNRHQFIKANASLPSHIGWIITTWPNTFLRTLSCLCRQSRLRRSRWTNEQQILAGKQGNQKSLHFFLTLKNFAFRAFLISNNFSKLASIPNTLPRSFKNKKAKNLPQKELLAFKSDRFIMKRLLPCVPPVDIISQYRFPSPPCHR